MAKAKADETVKENEQDIELEHEQETGEGAEQSEGHVGNSEQTDGVRARRGLALKMLLPNQEFIAKNIIAGGKGTRATIGRIYGIATRTDRKQNIVNDKTIESIVVTGMFDLESYITGEISRGSTCYFPMAYAEMIEAVFKADKMLLSVDVDCDIGLEATGKTIPYEWVCTAFREGAEMSTLKRLKATRDRPKTLLLTASGETGQLTLPSK